MQNEHRSREIVCRRIADNIRHYDKVLKTYPDRIAMLAEDVERLKDEIYDLRSDGIVNQVTIPGGSTRRRQPMSELGQSFSESISRATQDAIIKAEIRSREIVLDQQEGAIEELERQLDEASLLQQGSYRQFFASRCLDLIDVAELLWLPSESEDGARDPD